MLRCARLTAIVLLAGLLAASGCSRSSTSSNTGLGGSSSTTVAPGSANVADANFGTLHDVCGPNKTGKALTASDRGVTPSQISLTTISDPGFVGRPGLDQELFDASTVFTKWCNSLGGINGRKIKDNLRDAALTNYKQKVLEGCSTDFAMVGGGGVFDDAGQSARLNCLLPDYPGYVVSSQARGADLVVQAIPNALDNVNVGSDRYVAATFPTSTSKVGYLTGNIPATMLTKGQFQEAGKQLGWKTIYDAQYNAAGESTWTPFAQAVASKGVKGLVFVGEPCNLAKLEQAFSTIGYYPDWILVTSNFYDKSLITQGGSALKNTYVALLNPPYTSTAQVPGLAKYFALFQKYLPNGKSQAVLGLDSFSAWLLFARAAQECGVDLTRKCVYDHAKAITSWDGGGLTAPANPGKGLEPTCYTVMKAEPSGFTIAGVKTNNGPYNCDPKNAVTLKGNYGHGTTLASVGKSMADLP